jgi:hypothetical protein
MVVIERGKKADPEWVKVCTGEGDVVGGCGEIGGFRTDGLFSSVGHFY